jgi:hypothetical protein
VRKYLAFFVLLATMVHNLPWFMSTYHAFVHGYLSSDSHPGQLASETSKHLTTLNHTHSPGDTIWFSWCQKTWWYNGQITAKSDLLHRWTKEHRWVHQTTAQWATILQLQIGTSHDSEQYRPGWSSNNSLRNIMVELCCSALERHHCYYLRRFSVLIPSFSEGPFPQELNLAASFPRVEAAACNPPGECSAGLFRGSASNTRFTSSSISKSYTSSNTCWSENEEN